MQIDIMALVALMGIPSAVTGLCFWLVQRSINQRDADQKKREEARIRSELLLIDGVGASIALGEAVALACPDLKQHEDVAAALTYARKVKHDHKDFLHGQAAAHLREGKT